MCNHIRISLSGRGRKCVESGTLIAGVGIFYESTMRAITRRIAFCGIALVAGFVADAAAAGGGEGGDPVSPVLLFTAMIMLAASLGRFAARLVNVSPVIGEILFGVLIGNVGVWMDLPSAILVVNQSEAVEVVSVSLKERITVPDAAQKVFPAEELAPGGRGEKIVSLLQGEHAKTRLMLCHGLWLLSTLGVILLLFMVGLESDLGEMMRVGKRAFMVAILGVVAPAILGYAVSVVLLPELPLVSHLFLGAVLCATSVGITARVLRDMRKIDTSEAQMILGAAVIDDVLALIVLAIVVGIVTVGEIHAFDVGRIFLASALFLGVSVIFGPRILRPLIRITARIEPDFVKVLVPLTLAFGLSWLAAEMGLAAIVGAFVAGLILSDDHFPDRESGDLTVEELLNPIERVFAPIFFVLMGMQVDLGALANAQALLLAGALFVAACVGKLICGLPAGAGVNRLAVGFGMLPRGEVGLIFASVGRALGVVDGVEFSAVVVMVMLTTLVAPFGLKWAMTSADSRS